MIEAVGPGGDTLAAVRHALRRHGLPDRWRARPRFVVCEIGFGTGSRFRAALDLWRRDARRPRRLDWLAIDMAPLSGEALAAVWRERALASLAEALAAQWPPRVDGRHRLAFEDGAVVLHLGVGDAAAWLRGTEATVDAFLLDGAGAVPDESLVRSLARLAAEGATASMSGPMAVAGAGLARAGFAVASAASVGAAEGQGGERLRERDAGDRRQVGDGQPVGEDDDGAAVGRFAWLGARARPRAARAVAASRAPRTVAVIGAGVAGAAAARALADEGIAVVLLETLGAVASGTSAVAAGVFHAAIGPADGAPGAHARLARAAAFEIARDARRAIAAGMASGAVEGVLRVLDDPSRAPTPGRSSADVDPASAAHGAVDASFAGDAMAALAIGAWPDDALERRLGAASTAAVAGLAGLPGGRWMRFAGVVEPRGLVRWWLDAAGSRVRVLVGRTAHGLRAAGDRWTVLDAAGDPIADADAVVVAAGTATPALLEPWGAAGWPLRRVRGQASRAPAGTWHGPAPRLPLTGRGHAFVDATGGLVFGATSDPVAAGAPAALDVRAADHAFNAARLERLLGGSVTVDAGALEGAASERLVANDRLPLIGAVPVPDASGGAPTVQPRHVPRVPGLFVCGAFGARGVLWSSLAGRIVAAAVAGGPMPVESALVDAVDPARFTGRAARRGPSRGPE